MPCNHSHLKQIHSYATRCHLRLFMTVVMACRMVMPAFSVSFFDSPLVTHTFSAGGGCHSFDSSRGLAPRAMGMAFSRVMSTPLRRA